MKETLLKEVRFRDKEKNPGWRKVMTLDFQMEGGETGQVGVRYRPTKAYENLKKNVFKTLDD